MLALYRLPNLISLLKTPGKLPLLVPALCFAIGILLGCRYQHLDSQTVTLAFTYLFILLTLRKYRRLGHLLHLSFLIAGYLLTAARFQYPHAHISQFPDVNRAAIYGRIATFVQEKTEGKRTKISFTIDSKWLRIGWEKKNVNGRVQVFLINPKKAPRPGDWVEIRGSLKSPEPKSTPGEFDYLNYLRRKGITKTLLGIGFWSIARIEKPKTRSWRDHLEIMRANIDAKINELLPFPNGQIASALITGLQKNIPDEIYETFVKTGTAHLISISGLNISLIAGFFYFGIRLIGIFPPKIAALLAFVITVIYVFIGGANPPVARAGVMAGILLFTVIVEREYEVLNALLAACFVLLALDPLDLFSASFQLSFVAVLSIVLALELNKNTADPAFSETWIQRVRFYFLQDLKATWVTFWSLLPLILYHFNTISPIGFAANLAAIPAFLVINVLIIPITMIGYCCLPFAKLLAQAPSLLIELTHWLLIHLSKFPFAYFYAPSPSLIQIIMYYAGFTVFALRPKHLLMRFGASLLLVSAIAAYGAASYGWKINGCRLHFLDIDGQSAVVLESSDLNCLIYSGRRFGVKSIDWKLKPFLKSRGIKTLNHVFLLDNTKIADQLGQDFELHNIYAAGWKKSKSRRVLYTPKETLMLNNGMSITPIWKEPAHPKKELKLLGYEIKYRFQRFLIWLDPDAEPPFYLKRHLDLLYFAEPDARVLVRLRCRENHAEACHGSFDWKILKLSEAGTVTLQSKNNSLKVTPCL